ncbi:MAG: stalk domain-containing protein [Syntrophomonas sp.]
MKPKAKGLTFLLIISTVLSLLCFPVMPGEAAIPNDNNVTWSLDNTSPHPYQSVTVTYDIVLDEGLIGTGDVVLHLSTTYDTSGTIATKDITNELVNGHYKGSWTFQPPDDPDKWYYVQAVGPDMRKGTWTWEWVFVKSIIMASADIWVRPYETNIGCPNTVQPRQKFDVTLSEASIHPYAWMGFYKKGDADNKPISKYSFNQPSYNPKWTFTAPAENGAYEFRTFMNDQYIRTGTREVMVGFNTPVITVGAQEAHPGDDVKITWSNGPPHNIMGHMDMYHQDTLWGAFTVGVDPEGEILYHLHTKMPPGLYHVRMYADEDTLVGVSNNFAVINDQASGGGSGGGGSASTATTSTTDSTTNPGTSSAETGSSTTTGQSTGNIVLTVGQDKMLVNGGTDPSFHDTPVIVENRVFVPIGGIIRAMGGSTSWNADEQKVTISLNNRVLNLWIGQNRAQIDGQEASLDVPPFISSTGRTMLPLGFISKNLGSEINWDGANQRVTINYGTTSGTGTTTSTTSSTTSGTPTNTGTNVADSSLMAQYKFNGDFKDATGRGNDGIKEGDVSFADDSIMGKCAVFNGGFVNVKSTPELNLGDNFTISLWVKVDTANKVYPMISKITENGNYNIYSFLTRSTYGIEADISTSNGPGMALKDGPFTDLHLDDGWSHLVLTRDGSTVYAYHNGVQIAKRDFITKDGKIQSSSKNMRIGNGSDINHKDVLFKGKMDDLRIYNRTLSAGEILALYNGGTPTGN